MGAVSGLELVCAVPRVHISNNGLCVSVSLSVCPYLSVVFVFVSVCLGVCVFVCGACADSDGCMCVTCAGFDGCVCVWDVRCGASTAPHLMHHWPAHPGSEILTLLHDPMKNVIITAGNDSCIRVISKLCSMRFQQ